MISRWCGVLGLLLDEAHAGAPTGGQSRNQALRPSHAARERHDAPATDRPGA